MTEQKSTTFVCNGKWFDEFLADSSTEEQAWFLRAIFTYNTTGEVLTTSGQKDERYLKSHFKQMASWFDGNSERYLKRKIDNSLNQKIRWAKDRGDVESLRELEMRKEFLNEHSIDEYTHVYGRIAPNTDEHKRIPNDNDSVYVSDSVNDSVSDNDFDSDYDSYIDSLSDYESVTENVSDTEAAADALEPNAHLPSVFREDNLFIFTDYLKSIGIQTERFKDYIHSENLIGKASAEPLKDYIKRMTFLKNAFNRI